MDTTGSSRNRTPKTSRAQKATLGKLEGKAAKARARRATPAATKAKSARPKDGAETPVTKRKGRTRDDVVMDVIIDVSDEDMAMDAMPEHAASESALPKKRGRPAKNRTPEAEPTPEQMAAEESLIEEAEAAEKKRAKNAPAPGKDLLASYMDQLSRIPLFTPEQELGNARTLESLDLTAWNLVLGHPRAVEHLWSEATELENPLKNDIENLLQSYRRAAARSRKRKIPPHPAREKLIEKIGRGLRLGDYDKEVLDQVMQRLRREVWGRRVLDSSPSFRITHADLTEIEKARGAALRARNNFVRANLRLVVSVARNFHHYRIPFIDLIQEGNVGLMKAVHRFDHRRGFRFSTYAHWWIRQSIERAIINKGSQVRLPVHVIDSRRQIGRATAKLTQRLGRTPTPSEISKTVKMPKNKVEQILGGVQQDPVSLDESVGGDDPRKFLDLVRDDSTPGLDESLIRENTHERVRELLHLLNPIEKDIIRRRFGLGDDSDQTLDEIGKIYNLSRERVRQIQAQGLMKMRRMCERRKIS
jgi:RNA polymerase primary sigma factor